MYCIHCTAELPPNATFCGHCGRVARARRDTLVGTVIDRRYEIAARIAAGGFGAIYRATDLRTGRIVALKVLHADLALDRRLAARFRREGVAQSSLTNQHTIATCDVGEAPDGTLYIAMELLRGESLLDRFRREGTLSWRRVVGILRAICESLSEAHALGIVHRDLKLANIHLEDRQGNGDFVKVLDFGIAKVLRGSSSDLGGDELTLAGQAIGTLEYMSPEQLVGTDCDGRTDIYTLGVVGYELITGMRPFADATGPTSLITALLTQSPAPPSAVAASPVPKALDAILLRCLERDAKDRFATVDELAAALDQLVAMHPAPTPSQWALQVALDDADDEPTWVESISNPSSPSTSPSTSNRWIPSAPNPDVVRMPLAAGASGEVALAPIIWQAPPQPVVEQALAWHTAMQARSKPDSMQPFEFDIRGSRIGDPPLPEPVAPLAFARLLVWAVLLLATGVGLGMLAASLA